MCSPRAAKLAIGVLALALILAGAGCRHVTRVGRARTLRLALTEYRLKPQNAQVHAGTLRIAVSNLGRLTHNLVVMRGGQSIGSTRPIAPGRSARLTVVVKRGSYLMASTILSDQALGEYGTLAVTH